MKTVISSKDTEAFLAILDNEEPSEELKKAAEKYKKAILK